MRTRIPFGRSSRPLKLARPRRLSFETTTGSTVQVKRLIDEVSEASRQQSQGIEQVSHAIAEMEKVTQGTAATAEESAAASEELNAQAEASMLVVVRLAALVGGSAGTRVAARPDAATPAASRPKLQNRGKVVPMGPKATVPFKHDATPEQQIPLENTGTYGSF